MTFTPAQAPYLMVVKRGLAVIFWVAALTVATSLHADTGASVASDPAAVAEGGFDDFDEFGIDAARPVRDPLGRYNRVMFGFNDRLYRWLLEPVARGYGFTVPEQVRRAVRRCAVNLAAPVRFVNNGLQGKVRGARTELARFSINSTVGILGLFDPASAWFGLKPSDEDFGQTLGRYGVGPGCPLVLPLLGQTTLRDAIGMVPDYFLTPFNYVEPTELELSLGACETVNYISLHVGEYGALKESALDPYTLFRDGYLQRRRASIEE